MRRNQKKKKEKITKENKQTNSEIECTQVRGGFLGLGAGEYVQKPHKKNWGAKIEPAGCRQKLYFSGLCKEVKKGERIKGIKVEGKKEKGKGSKKSDVGCLGSRRRMKKK